MTIYRHEALTIYNYVLHSVYVDQQLHLGIETDATRTYYTAQKELFENNNRTVKISLLFSIL
jgi:hypothetical protein